MAPISIDTEEVLFLLDLYWFNQDIITKKPISTHLKTQSSPQLQTLPKEFSPLPSPHVRSLNDLLISKSDSSSICSEFQSPDSVLHTHRLQTILSGKQEEEDDENVINEKPIPSNKVSKRKRMIERKRRNRGSSKSLSDLEFDEVKGFMDLGFVFSEEDIKKSSELISIIPGLQRLGKRNTENNVDESIKFGDDNQESCLNISRSRPYLSEAWDVLDQRKKTIKYSLRIPAVRNEIDMKDHLKVWAHRVASTVK